MDQKAMVFDIQKYCVHDGPGVRTTIFFKGCSMSCQWCSNPESQNPFPEILFNSSRCIHCGNCIECCEAGVFTKSGNDVIIKRQSCINCGACTHKCYSRARTLIGREYSVEELIREVERDIEFYRQSGGGVTFSGGEPGLQPEAVLAVAKYFKSKNISTVLETCGFVPWENLDMMVPYLDLVLYDIKMWDQKKHEDYCGKPNLLIRDNLSRICKVVDTIVRIPIIPTVNDSEAELKPIAEFLQSLRKIKEIHILPYHNMALGKYEGLGREYRLEKIDVPLVENMEKLKRFFDDFGFEVKIGG